MLLRNIVKELSDTVEDLSGDIGRLSSEKISSSHQGYRSFTGHTRKKKKTANKPPKAFQGFRVFNILNILPLIPARHCPLHNQKFLIHYIHQRRNNSPVELLCF